MSVVEDLQRICEVPDAFYGYTRPSAGVSLVTLVRATNYAALRPRLNAKDLAAHLRSRPELVEQWERYSEDKRTSAGWYLQGRHVGYLGEASDVPPFESAAEACAAFILCELDDIVHHHQAATRPGSSA